MFPTISLPIFPLSYRDLLLLIFKTKLLNKWSHFLLPYHFLIPYSLSLFDLTFVPISPSNVIPANDHHVTKSHEHFFSFHLDHSVAFFVFYFFQ